MTRTSDLSPPPPPASRLRQPWVYDPRAGWRLACGACKKPTPKEGYDDLDHGTPWCRACVAVTRYTRNQARYLRKAFPRLADDYNLAVGLAVAAAGKWGHPAFTSARDWPDIVAAVSAATGLPASPGGDLTPEEVLYRSQHTLDIRWEDIDGRRSYRGHCRGCDYYTPRYWDPRDVGLSHGDPPAPGGR